MFDTRSDDPGALERRHGNGFFGIDSTAIDPKLKFRQIQRFVVASKSALSNRDIPDVDISRGE